MRRYAIVILGVLLITGCSSSNQRVTTETETWKSIVDKEWSNYEEFPGDGFYFYEEEGIAYCTYLIYGSGLPVIYNYKSLVNIEEGGIIEVSISLPETEEDIKREEVKVKLKYEEDSIEYNEHRYHVEIEGNSLDKIN